MSRFSIHPAGAAVLLLALLFAPSEQVLAVAAALLWHEGAHLAVMRLCGLRCLRVEITPFGGMIDARAFEGLKPFRQAVSAASGVAGSLLGAWGALKLAPHTAFGRALFEANASLALVNCLPAWPLDGARALVALGALLGCERGMRRLLHGVSILLGAGMVGLGLWGASQGHVNPSLLLAGPYLWYASGQGRVAAGIRTIDASAHPLQDSPFLPVAVFATAASRPPAQIIGQLRQQRYHLLFQIGEDGAVRRLWTQEKLLETLFDLESIDAAKK